MEFVESLGFMSFIKFGKFSAILSSNIFSVSLSHLWHSHYVCVGIFDGVPTGLHFSSFLFLHSFFFLLLSLNNLNLFTLKFTDSSFCQLKSTVEAL